MRGRKPGGGKTAGSGRKPGTPNKVTTDLKAVAQSYTQEALERLAHWMRSDNAPASVSAANHLLDRGYGKPPQALTDAEGGPLIPAKVIHEHVNG